LKKEMRPVRAPAVVQDLPFHRDLFEELRNLRHQLAEKNQMQPHMILRDEVLREISRQLPASPQELHRIRGIGKRKLQQWGEVVLEAVRAYRHRHPSVSLALAATETHGATRKSSGPKGSHVNKANRNETVRH
jgi:ATP-dependent DNA helicase RecQ